MSTVHTTAQMDVVRLTDDELDRAVEALTVPARPHRSAVDTVAGWAHSLWSTPNRAAATTVWTVGVVVLVVTALVHTTRAVQTSLGPARVSCGVNIYLYGDPDPAVNRACIHAEAAGAALFTVALAVVLAGLAVAGVLAARRHLPRPTTGTAPAGHWAVRRGRWVLAGLGPSGAAAALLALRPVPLAIDRSGTVVSLRCGADTYFGGYPDGAIQATCRRAYSGQAHVLEVAVVAAVVGAAAAVSILLSSGRVNGRRVGAGLAALAVAVIAVVSLSPATVQVRGGAAPEVASCGLDTYLAGYPDRAVQDACRAHYGARAAVGLPAAAVALALAGWAVRRTPEREPLEAGEGWS